MNRPPAFLLLLLLISAAAAAAPAKHTLPPTPSPISSPTHHAPNSSSSPLDPKQLEALRSLNIPTTKNPCLRHNSSSSSSPVVTCDNASPFRHVTSISFSNCSSELSLPSTSLRSLSTLLSLSFFNCPSLSPPRHLPLSLHSFSAVSSFSGHRKLSGILLARLVNLSDLTVSDASVSASGLYVIIGNMKKINSLVISHANLSGTIPKHLHSNLTHVDLSDNQLKGPVPTSITLLSDLQSLNLSRNNLSGEIPTGIGDLISLKNLTLASNKLSGSVPDTISSISGLTHVDLSGNQLNGTVPSFFSKLKGLKHLNLADNSFHGVLPFNASFLRRLEVFEVGGNSNLCYNHTVLSKKLKLGIAPCDKHGMPLSPPPQKDDDSSSDYDYSDDSSDNGKKKEEHHGPNKVVLGVAIGLASLVFLIVFLILLAKWCA